MNGCIAYQEDGMFCRAPASILDHQPGGRGASSSPNLLLAAEPPKRTLIRSVPAANVYSYENATGETAEEMENQQGKLISRRCYRPALPSCAYLHSVGLGAGRYWRDDDERVFHCLSPITLLGTTAEPYVLRNNLAYYVDGDAERIHQMLLKLNVNQRHEAQQALLRAAKALTQQASTCHCPRRRSRPTRRANPGAPRSVGPEPITA